MWRQTLYRQVTFVFRRVPPTASRASPDLFRRVHTAPPAQGGFVGRLLSSGPTGLMISGRPKDKTPLCVCREGF
ncbi:hypothetical protein J2T32_003400 [Kerstersia gyiorum]|nr:hypothetical protein [Kerstersia gyiorum]MCP1636367.1 hypothetical protein [Kerstersia gyiorum]MCP1684060.1 hypothetical protein [Kerstersia gyiorum]MCP1719730.1 hypothetical protein [Kerstersia gyiorum]